VPGTRLVKRNYIEFLFNDTFFPREERFYLEKNRAQWACGGGALPFERASLNVPDAFSWNSRLDWSTLIA
jgi:hypothetical protein